jgi:hypothetical protein
VKTNALPVLEDCARVVQFPSVQLDVGELTKKATVLLAPGARPRPRSCSVEAVLVEA